jgi:hypothetical protein
VVRTFPNDDGYEGLIVADAIAFNSLCRRAATRRPDRTSALHGAISDDHQIRQEFLAAATRSSHDR